MVASIQPSLKRIYTKLQKKSVIFLCCPDDPTDLLAGIQT